MHEYSLMADLFHKIAGISQENDGGQVLIVRIKLGALSHITPEHFEEHFIKFAKGTPAEGATLEITQINDIKDLRAQDIILDSVELAL